MSRHGTHVPLRYRGAGGRTGRCESFVQQGYLDADMLLVSVVTCDSHACMAVALPSHVELGPIEPTAPQYEPSQRQTTEPQHQPIKTHIVIPSVGAGSCLLRARQLIFLEAIPAARYALLTCQSLLPQLRCRQSNF